MYIDIELGQNALYLFVLGILTILSFVWTTLSFLYFSFQEALPSLLLCWMMPRGFVREDRIWVWK